MASDLEEKLARILSGLTGKPVSVEAQAAVPLRELGLSSLRMIQLLTELESSFQIRIPDDDVDGENFGDLRSLASYLRGRLGGPAA